MLSRGRYIRDRAQALLSRFEKRAAHEEWLGSVYIVMADGRICHPYSKGWVDQIDHPAPRIWDSLKAFGQFEMPDGSPSSAMPYQEKFLHDTTEMSAFVGGVGSGKTAVGTFRLAEVALANPGGLTIIGAAAAKLLTINVLPKIEAFVPAWAVVKPDHPHKKMLYHQKNEYGYFEMYWKNGHKTISLTLDVKTGAHMRIQGPDACGLWLDEASIIPEAVFKVFMERLRDEQGMLSQAWFTTSPDEKGWLEDLFIEGDPDRSKFALVKATTEEALFRTPAYYERLKRIYTKEEYRRKVLGEIVSYEGVVYEKHLHPDLTPKAWIPFQADPELPITVGIDLGYRRSAYVVGQETIVNGELVDVIFDEGQLSDTTAAQTGLLLAKQYEGWAIDYVYTDYSATSKPDQEELSDRMPGTRVKPAIDTKRRGYYRVQQGVNIVRHLCCDHNNDRHFYLSESLRLNTGRGTDNRSLVEALPLYTEPSHKDRIHILDALRYYCLGKYVKGGSIYIGAAA